MRTRHQNHRLAFTAVEIMIVVAIIAILAALLLPVLNRVLTGARETVVRQEIGQMDDAIQSFKTKYSVEYIPSRLRLCNKLATYTSSPSPITGLDTDSVKFLLRLFTKLNNSSSLWSTTGVSWTGAAGWTGDSTLEGHQVLVFCLGGVQSAAGGCAGFSTNPLDPSDVLTATPKGTPISPFFEFVPSRLTKIGGSAFLSYRPANSPTQPYAFFSSYGNQNGYARYSAFGSDNPSLMTPASVAIMPYVVSGTSGASGAAYYKPNTWQIISAGGDDKWGDLSSSGWLLPTSGTTDQNGKDDLCNFTPQRMGNPQ